MGSEKKQVPLRLSRELYASLEAWAKDDFRSLNGQIEYLLTQCVRAHAKGAPLTEELVPDPEPLAESGDSPGDPAR